MNVGWLGMGCPGCPGGKAPGGGVFGDIGTGITGTTGGGAGSDGGTCGGVVFGGMGIGSWLKGCAVTFIATIRPMTVSDNGVSIFLFFIFIDSSGNPLDCGSGGEKFLDGFFDGFAGFARAFLDVADKFVLLALGELEVVIRERGLFLFQLALGDVPVALDFLSDCNVAAKADGLVVRSCRLVKASPERFVVNERVEPQ